MKVAVLLFHESHFAQTLPFLKKYPINDVVIISLDVYSSERVKKSAYQFIIPEYKDKIMIRRELLRRMPGIIKAWGDIYVKKVKLKEYLRVKDFELWKILKGEIGIVLFDKLYFLELVKKMLIRSGADCLILPKSPSTIQLSYLVTVDFKTIIHLAESIGMPVLG
jgi:hypothetical protein